ncbi:MAG: PAS domain-containing protein [Actinomycetota bacterium]|nr:PAS domain-containing protein [Actinomycetota bacterium]
MKGRAGTLLRVLTEAGLRAVLEVVSDGVLAVDAEGRVAWLNPAAERLVGHRTADLEGMPAETVTGLRVARSVEVDAGRVRELAVFPAGAAGGAESPRETAHDFNNVLSVVKTYASFVLESARARGDAWEAIERDAESILEAVEDGLEVCRRLVGPTQP